MAKGKNKIKRASQGPQNKGNSSESSVKKTGRHINALLLLSVIVVVIAVLGGTFFIIIRNNINGIAEKNRDALQAIPVLRLALPEPPDPDDPRYLTDEQIKERYVKFRERNASLERELEEAKQEIARLERENGLHNAKAAEVEQLRQELAQRQEQLMKDKAEFERMAAEEDRTGFKKFYEGMDKENADRLYEEIIRQEKTDADAAYFSRIYESMDAGSAADILEEMGISKMDLIVRILSNMGQQYSSEILSEMDASFAAQVSEGLSQVYLQKNN